MSSDESDDWRLQGQDQYLSGITLVRIPYEQWSDSWDHDHCEFCWAKFVPEAVDAGETEHAERPIQRAGYTNIGVPDQRDHYWWICEECFEDFKDRFQWKVTN